jgi:hypothetical protein
MTTSINKQIEHATKAAREAREKADATGSAFRAAVHHDRAEFIRLRDDCDHAKYLAAHADRELARLVAQKGAGQ